MPTYPKLTYGDAKEFAIANLLRMAEAQGKGNLDALDENYDAFDYGLPRDAGPEFVKPLIALDFWDGWIDSKNHSWNFYEPIESRDWPDLARAIAEDLRLDSEISNRFVLEQFDYTKRPPHIPLLQRIKGLFGFGKQKL